MLLSIALIFLCGMALGKLFSMLKLPSLLGMLVAGIILGPYCLNLLDVKILSISAELRQVALVIILARAGMNLDIQSLKKVGRPAVLMCFVPACFEIIGMALLAPPLLGISALEAVLLGTVIAAVSPAVIVPRMLKLKDEGYGTNKAIPQMIMAGASVDDVFVIVLFTVFSSLLQTGEIKASAFLQIPTSIIFGVLGGVVVGLVMSYWFSKVHIRDSMKVIVILSVAFLLVTIEQSLTGAIGFSGLLAVMTLGVTLKTKKEAVSSRLSIKFSKLWICAEVVLFVLVGASVDIQYAFKAGIIAILLILLVLIFRVVGVFACLIKSKLILKEKLFTAVAYIPKATVQAAIGGLPLAMGLACGDIVLTVAVLSIIITAPIGAILIDRLYKKCLKKNCDTHAM